ncbi:hypothetical protein G8759_04985 [Spirosoma aureum]|uniref:Rhamnogalacturonase A/B/Epimerase-like pectate lyase domain-containing protein n=1 Tax=Spirosoma aureum TaxID=2692134 RepID=A0A6G9AIM6_9BACT|nr:glycosyl hydrolase family 28-related protein [Spirosoma aureum]QIP12033.1 hypothetical protein G8759_04985 [Spirosoma aureum]
MAINVKDAPFNAKGDGSVDDSAAIQQAVNFAKSLSFNTGTPYRATVYFPAGYYLIGTSINLTNTSGIWLKGDGGSYLNTNIIGNTGSRPMFDFTGSSNSGCESFSFISSNGATATNPSALGIQFARTTNGGLNCGIRNCYCQLNDLPSANGGLGSLGLLNIRSEEFFIHECLIRANTPLLLSYTSNIVTTNINYTASSAYQTLATGTGSMGVVNINATSLQSLEKRQPGMILIGTNSVNFQGYISRITASTGTNETAVLCLISTINLKIHATVESFSRVLQVLNSGFENCTLEIVAANATTPSTELIDVTNSIVAGLKAYISQPNGSERNRLIIYHAPSGGGTQQAAGYIINSEINCLTVPNNTYIISANLLKRATNVVFNTSNPFEKRNGRLKLLTNNIIVSGVIGSLNQINILQFQEARQATLSNNSGFYRVWIDGVIKAGGYGSGKAAALCFQAQIVVNQRYDGVLDPQSVTIITLDHSVTDPTYLNITGILVNLTLNNNIGTVTLIPKISGSGTGEPIYYEGYSELQSDFFINDPIPLT